MNFLLPTFLFDLLKYSLYIDLTICENGNPTKELSTEALPFTINSVDIPCIV